jgi:hypothetical protein
VTLSTICRRRLIWTIALAAAFSFRLLVGLSRELFFEDNTQIFLMGLRYYATGVWPYFGPDVVWSKSEIPGALQALLVGFPFRIAPVPEAPYVLLNGLSMAALAAFAWYLTARLPSLRNWLVWGWLMTLPWTLGFSTHIINPSYLLAPALVFFIGFFEATPAFRLGRIPEPIAFVFMGAATAWVLQIHMSWPLLLPYAALAWCSGWRRGLRGVVTNAAGFAFGLLLIGVFVIPTFLVYGIHAGSGGTMQNLRVHWVSPWIAVTTLARLFSFASFEIWRFIATDDGKRWMLLRRHLWMAPMAGVVWLAGLWQPVWMLREWFRVRSPLAEWRSLKWLMVGTVALVYVSFGFVLEAAQAHAFYIVAPVAFVFAASCWTHIDSTRWRQVAAAILVVNIAFHIGQAWIQIPLQSLYHAREPVAAAVRLKQPEMFGHRRPFATDAGPVVLQDPSRLHNSRQDIQLSDVQPNLRLLGRVALWTMVLRNGNERVAYRDIRYVTRYRDAGGRMLDERIDYIKDIFQPGTVTAVEVNDGLIARPFVTATFEVLDADALLPIK